MNQVPASVNKSLKPVVDVYHAHVQPRLNRWSKQPYVAKAAAFASAHVQTVARLMIAGYFANLAVTNFNYWYRYNVPGIPWAAFPMLPCALAVMFNQKVCAVVLLRGSLSASFCLPCAMSYMCDWRET